MPFHLQKVQATGRLLKNADGRLSYACRRCVNCEYGLPLVLEATISGMTLCGCQSWFDIVAGVTKYHKPLWNNFTGAGTFDLEFASASEGSNNTSTECEWSTTIANGMQVEVYDTAGCTGTLLDTIDADIYIAIKLVLSSGDTLADLLISELSGESLYLDPYPSSGTPDNLGTDPVDCYSISGSGSNSVTSCSSVLGVVLAYGGSFSFSVP